jgi:Phosphotransferase enzyme family
MSIILDTHNVFEYLATLNYCQIEDRETSEIVLISAKNFNLLINFADGKSLLVKQERSNLKGRIKGEFWAAWEMKQFVTHFPQLGEKIQGFLPELLYFDPENSILIVNFLSDYSDLHRYYSNENQFPIEIASSIGNLLATIHSQTFEQVEYQKFFDERLSNRFSYDAINIIDRFSRITPRIFQKVPLECLRFFELYQRFPSLSQAIEDLGESIAPSCLVHNDLKINNFLVELDWQRPGSQIIRLIDWERVNWGDPAFDLGCMLGSYLEIWLYGLKIGNNLSINESLQLATIPLETIQPSLFNLVKSYLLGFPAITVIRSDYLNRVIQFAGFSLIRRVEITISKDRFFGDRGIIMLQVGKQLICTPQAAMKTLFGNDFTQLINK